MTRKVIIGSWYGDCAKGAYTDYFARQSKDGLVIRFNGGSQAGHTVVTPDKRHVFGHIGSGALAGVPTYLSEFFIANPITFHKEYEQLGMTPVIYLDEKAIVTTPYDMLINQIAETVRGDERHGSCGLGINETVERNNNEYTMLTVDQLYSWDRSTLRDFLMSLRESFVDIRLEELQIDNVPDEFAKYLKSDGILNSYLDMVEFMMKRCMVVNDGIMDGFEDLIFEGAQGLKLSSKYWSDENPYVTSSHTGFQNASSLLKNLKNQERVDLFYLTRPYITRHGAGPLKNELSAPPYPGIVDETNLTNRYQGNLRFAYFDVDEFIKTVFADLMDVVGTYAFVNIGVSCLDQVPGTVRCYRKGELTECLPSEMLYDIADGLCADSVYGSFGPTAKDIVLLSNGEDGYAGLRSVDTGVQSPSADEVTEVRETSAHS